MEKKRLIVIGGGAAGFFCAVNAARMDPSMEVRIVEKSNKLLSKVRISGGGRCNVTHTELGPAELARRYPRGGAFLKKAFHHFTTTDTIDWFEKRGVPLKTEPDGRVFPQSDSSESVIQCLLTEVNRYGVQISMNCEVRGLYVYEDHPGGKKRFELEYGNGKREAADLICIASGGRPKISDYQWITGTFHEVEDPVPSLFTFNMPGDPVTDLMGISVERATVKIAGTKLSETGPLMITHWGLSGPAILRLSAWGARLLKECNYDFTAMVNWAPDYNDNSLRDAFQKWRFSLAAQKMSKRNPLGLPARLWEYLLKRSGIHEDTRWADLPAAEQNKLIRNTCSCEFPVRGKTTFKEEFVTAGGVRLDQVDFNTMQSRTCSGLFFCGEVLDADGITGGFNFQQAWTTGWIAARAIAGERRQATDG